MSIQPVLSVAALTLTVVIFFIGYRFTVRESIRTAVGEVPPLFLQKHSVTPVVNSVKWRPVNNVKWRSVAPQTTLKFIVYENGDERRPANAKEFGRMLSLHEMDGADLQRELESRLGSDYNLSSVKEVNLYQSGINIPCQTNKPDELQNVATAFLIYCSE